MFQQPFLLSLCINNLGAENYLVLLNPVCDAFSSYFEDMNSGDISRICKYLSTINVLSTTSLFWTYGIIFAGSGWKYPREIHG